MVTAAAIASDVDAGGVGTATSNRVHPMLMPVPGQTGRIFSGPDHLTRVVTPESMRSVFLGLTEWSDHESAALADVLHAVRHILDEQRDLDRSTGDQDGVGELRLAHQRATPVL